MVILENMGIVIDMDIRIFEVSPAQTPACKPAGGKREVKTRLEEPGGGWRMEVLNISFIFKQGRLVFNQFVVCGLAGQPS